MQKSEVKNKETIRLCNILELSPYDILECLSKFSFFKIISFNANDILL